MGGGDLHQALRSLCFNTDWTYAVFWKLKHRARMVLTWEDAYYDHHGQNESSGSKFLGDMGSLHDGYSSHDILGLAVAKMSYHVYSLGEGIVGEVAATGKYVWISRDKHGNGSCSSPHTQFSAGIRTIAVVAVAPHGVVQLGSLCSIADLTINTKTESIYYMDPAEDGRISRNQNLKQLVELGMRAFRTRRPWNTKKADFNNFKWNNIQCSKQPDGIHCGHYVGCFIESILLTGETSIPVSFVHTNRIKCYPPRKMQIFQVNWA